MNHDLTQDQINGFASIPVKRFNQKEDWLLYEMPKSRRLVLVQRPFMHLKPYGLQFIDQFDSLEDVCVEAERLKVEREDEDEKACLWGIELV